MKQAKSSKSTSKAARSTRKLNPKRISSIVNQVFGASMHAARVNSLGLGVVGVVHAATLAIHAIGQAYAQSAGITAKSGVKQIDRMLSNSGMVLDTMLETWVQFVVGGRPELVLAMDWTEFDDDDHSTLAVYVVTNHGRATPLAWRTYLKSQLKDHQKAYEYDLIERIHGWLDPKIRITVLADRGFGDQKLYEFLMFLGWDFVIRFRGKIVVCDHNGEAKMAREWIPPTGRATMLKNAKVTQDRCALPAVVVTWDKKMKEAWCLATTLSCSTASAVVKKYGRRFTIEETFRDQKDLHFGMGLKATHIRKADRRDRILMLAAVAQAVLTLLGAAAERSGLDKYLKVNTVKRRTHSLYRQGLYWYGAIPEMRSDWLTQLIKAFDDLIREHSELCKIIGII
jgi:Transposase DDE domain